MAKVVKPVAEVPLVDLVWFAGPTESTGGECKKAVNEGPINFETEVAESSVSLLKDRMLGGWGRCVGGRSKEELSFLRASESREVEFEIRGSELAARSSE